SKLVLRGGYSRTYDPAFNNIALNIASSFPMVLAYSLPVTAGVSPNAYSQINTIRGGALPSITNFTALVRKVVNSQFRSPFAEQFSMQVQRELRGGFVLSTGWVGTKGTALFQSTDGNPTIATPPGVVRSARVDPTRGVVRERCNCTSSVYHSWQT